MAKTQTHNYDKLAEHFQKISHFEHFSALGDWDQATMMPTNSATVRSNAMASLHVHIHQLKTVPMLPDAIASAKLEPLDQGQSANLREIEQQYMSASVIPSELVAQKSKLSAKCEHAWRQQRLDNDWQGFKPNLESIVNIAQQEAKIRSEAFGVSPYDAMLQKFEPSMTAEKIAKIFSPLKIWLPEMINQVVEKQRHETQVSLAGDYNTPSQLALSASVMELMSFDFTRGRIDLSAHPFTGGVPGDVRITSRFERQDFTNGLLSTIHETGHAKYEQGLPQAWRYQPAGLARSMAIHESQSLFCEMFIGREPAFARQLVPLIEQHLSTQVTAGQLSNSLSRVKPGLIRVDADEVTYPCHILLRFEAEQKLISGELAVADLPDFWSSQMQQLLGINTDGNYRDGCMQDIHWAVAEFGYFPSYSLGAMYAAQLSATINKQLGPISELIEQQQLGNVFSWLNENIWSKGSLLSTDSLIEQATGEPLNPLFLQQHIQHRYLGS